MYFSGIMTDLGNSCVGDFCVYYCDVVADIWDSCVIDFCVYFCGIVADLWNSCVDNCSVEADLSLSCVYYYGISLVGVAYWLISGIPGSGISVCTTLA